MTYPDISTVNATNDLSQLLIYANTITNGIFMPGVLFGFFTIVMLGSYFAQIRFSGRGRLDVSFTVAGFTSFGLSIIMMLSPGVIGTQYAVITLIISIIGAMWLFFGND